MRTKLDLEKPVLKGLKSLQKKEKLTLEGMTYRLLAEALASEASGVPGEHPCNGRVPVCNKVEQAFLPTIFRTTGV